MALRKPLVMGSSGLPQQLQAGDTLDATVAEVDVITRTSAQALIAGNVVYASSATEVDKARANAVGTSKVIGFAKTAVGAAASVVVQTSGVIALTTGEWDALFGTTGGLTFNTLYFLDPATAGLGTVTPPTTVGQTVVLLGTGLSTTELLIAIEPYILL